MLRPILTIAPLVSPFVLSCQSADVLPESASIPSEYVSPVVLFIDPDERKLEQLRREYGEDYYTMTDDAMWYRSQAYDLLEEAGIPYANPQADEAWFEVNGVPTRFSWRDVDKAWFLILYNGHHEPNILHDIDLPFALEEIDPDPLP